MTAVYQRSVLMISRDIMTAVCQRSLLIVFYGRTQNVDREPS
jgi:hypothetical protein